MIKLNIVAILSILVLSLLISSCKKTDQAELDREIIENYVSDNNLVGQFNESGLYYVIEEAGGEDHPDINSTVTVMYKGYRLDGVVFEESDDPITSPLSGFIRGWKQGLQYIGAGGKITLIIPSGLAYGYNGKGDIGPNEVLAFDISLISFEY